MIGYDNTVAMTVNEATYILALLMIDIEAHPNVVNELPDLMALRDRLMHRISQGD